MLSGMFRYAVRKGALPVNPVREAQLVKNVEAKGPTGGAGHIEVDDLRFILTAVRGSVLPCPRKLTKKERERTAPIKSYTPPTVAEYCEEADLADLVTLAAAVGGSDQVSCSGWNGRISNWMLKGCERAAR
jgi:hypothetical protein